MNPTTAYQKQEARLIAMVRASPQLMAALHAAKTLRLPSWAIGAGAVRSLVWDELHGFKVPTPYADLDLVFYVVNLNSEHGQTLIKGWTRELSMLYPQQTWEIVNQAAVHEWQGQKNGCWQRPFLSLEEGIASWPEVATCVAVYLDENDQVGVIAPHGLDDLFSLKVRHNSLGASKEVYRQRLEKKRFLDRWPLLDIVV